MTRPQHGIVQLKKHTDGTIAWFAACHTHGVADPTLEPANHHEAIRIPHWRDAMELEFKALLKNETW
jgi:hypothetical protein